MGSLVCLVGKKIIVQSVMPPKKDEEGIRIFKNRIKILFSWKSRKRKGFCKAFIQQKVEEYVKDVFKELPPLDIFLKILTLKFKSLYKEDYEISTDTGMILLGKILCGECSKYKTRSVSDYSGEHGANQTEIEHETSSLCYPDPIYATDVKFVKI